MIFIFIIIGVLLFILFSRKRDEQTIYFDSHNHSPKNEKANWSLFTTFSETKIYSKYAGELRFGPAFIHLKSAPENAFGRDFYGDWFYRVDNGVYLQKWNSNPVETGVHTKANNDLVFYNHTDNTVETIKKGIKSFHWNIEKNSEGLTLVADNGKRKESIKIE